MDTSVAPGDDFWTYANGSWIKAHPIPADRSDYGVARILVDDTNKRTVDLIQGAAASARPGSDAQKVGDYYASFMDEAGIEAKGIAPIKPMLARVAAITDRTSLGRYLGENLRADVDALNSTDLYTDNIFGLWVSPAADDPSRYAPYLMQGGLGMPDREYYLSDAEAMKEARTKYQAYIAAMLELAGIADAQAKAARILALESKIAQTHAPRADADDVNEGQQSVDACRAWRARAGARLECVSLSRRPRDATALHRLASDCDRRHLTPGGERARRCLEGLSGISRHRPLRQIICRGHLSISALRFYGTALEGTPQIRARWKRAVDATNNALGEAVGKLYVAEVLPAAIEGTGTGDGRQHHRSLQEADRGARVDGASDQGRGPAQAVDAEGGYRIPRHLARLFDASRSCVAMPLAICSATKRSSISTTARGWANPSIAANG